jgi:hypothetical protein
MLNGITWLRELGVRVLFHTVSFYSRLQDMASSASSGPIQKRLLEMPLACVVGTYLKIDILKIIDDARLFESGDLVNSHVLWTDADVMWWSKVNANQIPLPLDSPVAYSTETDQSSREPMNAGVVWFNLPRYHKVFPLFANRIFFRAWV